MTPGGLANNIQKNIKQLKRYLNNIQKMNNQYSKNTQTGFKQYSNNIRKIRAERASERSERSARSDQDARTLSYQAKRILNHCSSLHELQFNFTHTHTHICIFV